MANINYLAIDTETSKLPKHNPWVPGSFLCSIGLRTEDWNEEYIFNHETAELPPHAPMLEEIQKHIDACEILVFHNAKFDLNWLRYMGLRFDHKPVWCCQVAEYLLYGQNTEVELSLNSLGDRYGAGQKLDAMSEYWKAGFETDQIPLDIHKTYLAQDTNLTAYVFLKQFPAVQKAKLEKVAYLSFEVSKIISEMECNGIPFDKEAAEAYVEEYSIKVKELDKELYKLFGFEFKINSAVQLRAALFGGQIKRQVQELVAKPRKNGTFRVYTRKSIMLHDVKGIGFIPNDNTKSKKTDEFSTGQKALAWLRWETPEQEEVLKLLASRSNAAKVYSTLTSDSNEEGGLLRKIGKDKRIHPSFGQTFTVTGRLNSKEPNGQNLPRGNTSPIKKLIKPAKGRVIVNCDLSQIEWRIAAALSGDELMCQEIRDGFDVHTDRVHRSFLPENSTVQEGTKAFKVLRNTAKTFNFRMLYNGKAKAFFYDANMPRFTLDKWKKIVPDFYAKYNQLRKWQLMNERIVNSTGFLRNPSGRFITFKFYRDNPDHADGYNLNAICNYPIQSGSLDLMMLATVHIWRKLKALNCPALLIFQVHDALVFECLPEDAYLVGRTCLDVFDALPQLAKDYFDWDINVPLTGECSMGPSYGETPAEFISKETSGAKSPVLTKENVDAYLTTLT